MIDLTGQKFGKWTVLGPVISHSRHKLWNCQCECDLIKNVRQNHLLNGESQQCRTCSNRHISKELAAKIINQYRQGKSSNQIAKDLGYSGVSIRRILRKNEIPRYHKRRHDLVGQKFNSLLVIGDTNQHDRNNQILRICQCDCGNLTTANHTDLVLGRKKSCGCQWQKILSEFGSKNRTHGMSGMPTYHTWRGIIQRITNPNSPSYSNYGGRGIKVCDRWLKFENFFADMGECPPKYSIERVDVNGNYCPENCKYIPILDQALNRRDTHHIRFRNADFTVKEFAALLKRCSTTIIGWIHFGLVPEEMYQRSCLPHNKKPRMTSSKTVVNSER